MLETTNALVVPIYRNANTIPALLDAISELADECDGDFQAVFVVDGSPDDSLGLLAQLLRGCGFQSRLIELSRNFGSFAAIRTGLSVAQARYIAVMAADLQEPPELVSTFLSRLRSGEVDVVAGERRSRSDRGDSFSKIYWRLYSRFVVPDIPPDGVDVFACTAEVRDVICSLESVHTSLVAQLFWVGFRRELVGYDRRPSEQPSGWTFSRKVRYLLDSVFAFTDLPVRALWGAGVIGLIVAVGVAIAVLIARAIGAISVPGYAATVIIVVFFASLNLLGLGIVGSYVWRAYELSKGRPGAIVRGSVEFSGAPSDD